MALTWLYAVILGIVEGLTEFLPVSSTFHLIFTGNLLGLEQTDFLKMFEVAIQTGAILAVLTLYGRELLQSNKLLRLVAVSFVPTAVVGFVLHTIIKEVFFESRGLMIGAFMAVGLIFIGYERWLQKNDGVLKREIADLSWVEAVMIGLGQALAVVPGVSRAGAVILAMMLLGVRRDQAAKYSFILALPTIAAAGALDVLKFEGLGQLGANEWSLLGIGMVVSCLTALGVLRWFIKYVQQQTLEGFGWYRIATGIVLLISTLVINFQN